MNFLYTCDNNYVWLMSISMISLFKSNSHIENITIYLIGDNISNENKGILKRIAEEYKREIIIIDLIGLDLPNNLNLGRWPQSALARLYCGNILPLELKKVVYLDCDTIIKEKLDGLFDIKMNDNFVVYGVKDCISGAYKKNIGLIENDNYINAGVLLINLKKLREYDIKTLISNFVEKYGIIISYADQDILNGIFKGKIGCLDPKYDVMTIEFEYQYKDLLRLRKTNDYYTEKEINNAINNPYIIHYTTNLLVIRPWYSNSNHKKKQDFLIIYQENNFFNVDLKKYKFKGIKNVILRILQLFPKRINIELLGIVHGIIVPKINSKKV